MSVLAVIPARGGSQRIPRKNLQEIAGLTLVQHAALAAIDACVDALVVSTDEPEIACGYPLVLRPERLSGPTVDISQVVRHALVETESKTGERYDQVITLQPTIPLRPAGMIKCMLYEKACNGAVSALTVIQTVPWCWRLNEDNHAWNDWTPNPYPRSQDVKLKDFQEINAVQISDRDIVLQEKRWELPLLLCAMPRWANIDIDEQDDLDEARKLWPLVSGMVMRDMPCYLVSKINVGNRP